MKRKFLVFIAVLLSAVVGLSQEIAKPKGYVSDYVGLLKEWQVREIDDVLKKYDQQTSIQFVVVIVDSLQGYEPYEYATTLGREWGVGQKDKNNGLVLLVAPNERKYFLAVGYGLEGDLPDGKVGSILRANLVPYFKKGQMFEGIQASVNAVIESLGTMPMEQRVAERKAKQALLLKQQAENAAWWRWFGKAVLSLILGLIFVVLLPIFLLIALYRAVNRWLRKQKLREFLSLMVKDYRKKEQAVLKGLDVKLKPLLKQLPLAKDKNNVRGYRKKFEAEIRANLELLQEIEGLIYPDPYEAEHELKRFILSDEQSFYGLITDRIASYQEAVQEIKTFPVQVLGKIQMAESYFKSVQETGFWVESAELVQPARDKHTEAELYYQNNPEDPENALKILHESLNLLGESLDYVNNLVELHKTVSNQIDAQQVALAQFDYQHENAVSQLRFLAKKYTLDVVSDLQAKFDQFDLAEFTEQIEALIDEAIQFSDMSKQNFDQAHEIMNQVELLMEGKQKLLARPEELKQELDTAKESVSDRLNRLNQFTEDEGFVFEDSDVGSDTQAKYHEAVDQYQAISDIVASNSSSIDWLTFDTETAQLEELLSNLHDVATEEISAAERRRRRRRAASNSGSSSVSSSGFGGSSGGSSSSSGFSGGGGSFGGGGAGGDW